MLIKTSELTGAALDRVVVLALGYTIDDNGCAVRDNIAEFNVDCFNPSTNPAQGYPIIEREKITTDWAYRMEWKARLYVPAEEPWVFTGPTILIAAMRCFVASKLGDEVEIPEELC